MKPLDQKLNKEYKILWQCRSNGLIISLKASITGADVLLCQVREYEGKGEQWLTHNNE